MQTIQSFAQPFSRNEYYPPGPTPNQQYHFVCVGSTTMHIDSMQAHITYIIQQHMTDSNLIIWVPLCSLLGNKLWNVLSNNHQWKWVRLVCSDASIQPYPLVLLSTVAVDQYSKPSLKYLCSTSGRSWKQKISKFLQDRSHPVSKKSDAPKGRVAGSESCRGGFLIRIQRWGHFLWFIFSCAPFKDIWKVLKRKNLEISSAQQPSSVWKSGAANLRLQSSESCRRDFKIKFHDFFFDFCCSTPW